MSTAPQKAKGPAEAATSPDHGSTNPAKEKEMNTESNITASADAPATRPLKLQLLEISDLIGNAANLVDALDMATSDITDSRQRNAMAGVCDVLMERMDVLKDAIESAREELA